MPGLQLGIAWLFNPFNRLVFRESNSLFSDRCPVNGASHRFHSALAGNLGYLPFDLKWELPGMCRSGAGQNYEIASEITFVASLLA